MFDPNALDALLAGSDAGLEPFERGMLEALAEQFDEIESRGESVESAWFDAMQIWPSGPDDGPIDPLVELSHRLEAASTRGLVAGASGACGGPGFDAKTWLEGQLKDDSAIPGSSPAVPGVIRVQRELARRAWLAALDGNADEAVEFVRLGFCAARAFQDAPGHHHFLAWLLQTDLAVQSLDRIARFLPAAELQEFDATLASLDVRRRLVRSLEQERAILYRAFSSPGPRGDGPLAPAGRVQGLWSAYDRRAFLRAFRAMIEAGERSTTDTLSAARDIEERLRAERFPMVSQILMPPMAPAAEAAIALEARAAAARAELLRAPR